MLCCSCVKCEKSGLNPDLPTFELFFLWLQNSKSYQVYLSKSFVKISHYTLHKCLEGHTLVLRLYQHDALADFFTVNKIKLEVVVYSVKPIQWVETKYSLYDGTHSIIYFQVFKSQARAPRIYIADNCNNGCNMETPGCVTYFHHVFNLDNIILLLTTRWCIDDDVSKLYNQLIHLILEQIMCHFNVTCVGDNTVNC